MGADRSSWWWLLGVEFLNLVQAQREVVPPCSGDVYPWPTRRVAVWELRISELELGVFLLFLYHPELHMPSLFYPLHFEDFLHCDKIEGKLDMITSIGY